MAFGDRLRRDYPNEPGRQVSAETIYNYLYVLSRGALRRELLSHLRQHRKKRRPHSRGTDRRGQIPEMISIEECPPEEAERTIPGHWEGDMILGRGHQSALGTLVERTTRTVLLVRLPAQDAVSVRKAFARKPRHVPTQMKLLLTYDRGKEMAEHKLFTRDTKMQVYFAHLPWERGTNENTNDLIRQYFPKGTNFNEAWAVRMAAISRKSRTGIASGNALNVTRDSEAQPGLGVADGNRQPFEASMKATVTPEDHDKVPVAGRLITLNAREININWEDSRVGDVNVHFPRTGYCVEAI